MVWLSIWLVRKCEINDNNISGKYSLIGAFIAKGITAIIIIEIIFYSFSIRLYLCECVVKYVSISLISNALFPVTISCNDCQYFFNNADYPCLENKTILSSIDYNLLGPLTFYNRTLLQNTKHIIFYHAKFPYTSLLSELVWNQL